MRHTIPAAANRSRFHLLAVAALLASSLLPTTGARAANFWVGNNGNPPCTHATLQAAIETAVGSAGDDVISLVGPGPFTGPFTVFGGGIHIRGNVGSCGSDTSVGYATLRAPSGSRPLTILMGGAETVRLQRVILTTDGGTYNGDGGAIWFAGANNDSYLDLIDAQVVSSVANGDGGGIYVSAGKLGISISALVGANAASHGGGIAARNGALVEVRSGMVLGNTALFDGGGIYAPDSAVNVINAADPQTGTVSNNIAGQKGGGLYLGGGFVDIFTSQGRAYPPARIGGNQAQWGGGLYVDGADVRLRYVSVDHNTAFGDGGGVYATGNGAVVTNGFLEPIPLDGFPRLDGNSAGDGAALFLAANAGVILNSGRMRDNHGAAGAAMVAATGTGSSILNGVTMQNNALFALIGLAGSGSLDLLHLSIAGNTVAGLVRWRGADSILYFTNSALDETEPFFASVENPSSPAQLTCVVSKWATPFANVPPNTVSISAMIADPQFVAPPADLHLRYGSPAIDLCARNEFVDSDGDARSYDDPYHSSGEFPLADAGADETTVLFVDAIEAGAFAGWSGRVP
ncbi:MAG TPA: hypothetical protein VGS57_04160 [Thermoanaerobaculia bacterium]|nr:hypothetical protein [Thermoanaerobaculia bacterium]